MKEAQIDQLFSNIRELPSEVSLEQVQGMVNGAAAGTLVSKTSLSGKVFAKSLLNLKFLSLMGILITTALTLGLIFIGNDTETDKQASAPDQGEKPLSTELETTAVDSPEVKTTLPVTAADTSKKKIQQVTGATTVSAYAAITDSANEPAYVHISINNGTAYVDASGKDAYATVYATLNDTDDKSTPALAGVGSGINSSASCNASSGSGKLKSNAQSTPAPAAGNATSGCNSWSGASYVCSSGVGISQDDTAAVATRNPGKNNLIPKIFTAELIKDKLVGEKDDHVSFQLTKKGFKVDGKKQPEEVFKKYLRLYEETTGEKVDSDFSYYYFRNGDSRHININN